ncbi:MULTISPECIES: response regulator transcription factor [Porphyromonas]|uniref:Transcriptional regulator n=1 Tax=Porphyromonas canoris TaxID=36875 RepID=A0ABR4XNP5_9PORP|nr:MULTISPECIES: response regulator transcription factor [Porphyromonas]KGL52470.1 transcriptional regulator [Porphyromonas canoris]KGN70616.1 transcriptional regulator [Porphyromonas sp. COT-108 OH1349]KGN93425.1 transcriptional regulator [Porphyromonas canoris]KGN96011.1 transcriptional regulator [Porphyromonas sp. COT-108 OH2963]
MKILIVEDEPQLQELIAETLTKERYIVEIAKTLSEAREKIGLYSYDGVLLDLMLPDGSGLTLLEEMKQAKRQERIIIISARDAVEDKVKGLELGADDYLSKPFHLIELSARLRSVIRRNQSGDLSISLGNVEIFPDKFSVTVSDNRLELNRKEYDILLYFANRVDRLVRKELLAEAVWGDNIDQVDNFDFIYTQIKNLRKKLQDSNANIKIKSVYGIGYKMVME